MLFPVTAASGVWAAYSKNFVERLSEIYAQRARTDAEKLVAWMDSLDQALKWQFSGFDAKYLKQQAMLCQDYTTEGFNPDRTIIPPLERVFVPLQLSSDFIESRSHEKSFHQPPEGLSIWDLLRRARKDPTFRQMVIQAKGGFGKTTLLRHITLIYGERKQRHYRAPKLIPFLIYLRDWRDLLARRRIPDLAELITDHYLPNLPRSQPLSPPPNWAEYLLREGDALVMLDGFDELAEGQRQQVSYWITLQMRLYHRSTFILTSRPAGYQDYVAKRPTVPLFVQEFNLEQQRDFVERWYFCQESYVRGEHQHVQAKVVAEQKAENLLQQLTDPSRPELQEMAVNPLLLNMLATFHRFDPGTELPRRRIELYKGICKLQLEDRPRARGILMLLPMEKSLSILQNLALSMVIDNRPTISRRQILEGLSKHKILLEEGTDPIAFLKQIVQVSELLVEREQNEFEFLHLSFQGYFAATYLAQRPVRKVLVLLRQNWDKAWWRETILLYTAQLSPKLLPHFIHEVIHEASQMSGDAAQLAYSCLQEYRNPEKLDPALEQQLKTLVQTLRYQQLEKYLKTQQWKEADKETYQLMITTVGKEEGQWFYREDLLHFPCEELRAIDQLWVKYSNGLFGFSVQKQIYVECGAKLDGEYPGNEIWDKFGNRVGWRKENRWLSYEELSPSLSSLQGSLPGWKVRFAVVRRGAGFEVIGEGKEVGVWLISSLAYRLAECRGKEESS